MAIVTFNLAQSHPIIESFSCLLNRFGLLMLHELMPID